MSLMMTEVPVERNCLTSLNFCAEILCEPTALCTLCQHATPFFSSHSGSRLSMAMITMLVMPERRLASTHFSSCPITFELHTAVSTSRSTATFFTTSHRAWLSSWSQLTGHADPGGAT